MTIRDWLTRLFGDRRRLGNGRTLREFVYLDEVSVYSLHASLLGMLDEKMTENHARSQEVEASGSVQGKLLVAEGKLGGRARSTQSRSTQIVRKSIIQTTFGKLHKNLEEEHLAISPPTSGGSKWRFWSSAPPSSQQIIDPQTLRRGALVEIETIIEAEASFQIQNIIDSITTIFRKHPDLQFDGLDDAATYSEIMRTISIGLVPIQGVAQHYSVAIDNQGHQKIVHKDKLSSHPEQFSQVSPLNIVGVAEESLFWKDIRRFIFSSHPYTCLCRVSKDGLHEDWSPIGLFDGLSKIYPPAKEVFCSS